MAVILVVDDEIGIRELLSEILSDEGYGVLLAENASAARSAMTQHPDLVLLDIWMPDNDGVSLLKEWNATGQLNVPVIMMSGHATLDTAVEATKFGAVDFLEKPIALSRLQEGGGADRDGTGASVRRKPGNRFECRALSLHRLRAVLLHGLPGSKGHLRSDSDRRRAERGCAGRQTRHTPAAQGTGYYHAARLGPRTVPGRADLARRIVAAAQRMNQNESHPTN